VRFVTGLSPRRPGFSPGSVNVGFVLDKVALRKLFIRVFRFPLSVSFHHGSPCSYIIWEMNNRPAGGRSSETQSHPIDKNNNNHNKNKISDTTHRYDKILSGRNFRLAAVHDNAKCNTQMTLLGTREETEDDDKRKIKLTQKNNKTMTV
jgi:hypothetical protein